MNTKKYAVYYRTMPFDLEALVNKDHKMTMSRDGIYRTHGHACPRLTITVESVGADSPDKDRIRSLERLLTNLEKYNQIVSWS